jgi:hypothetical protein
MFMVTNKKRMEDGRLIRPLMAGKRFGRYKKEAEKALRKMDVREDQTLRQLIDAWTAFRLSNEEILVDGGIYVDDCWRVYENACAELTKVSYSSADVTRFGLKLAEFEYGLDFHFLAGLFLTALANMRGERSFTIHTAHLGSPLHYLGMENTRDLIVLGDVGYNAGNNMQDGSMLIEGNALGSLGACMRQGTIHVTGDAGNDIGYGMTGGEIVVDGDVGFVRCIDGGRVTVRGHLGAILEGYEGPMLAGGELRIEGTYDRLGEIEKGKVYLKGHLLADK